MTAPSKVVFLLDVDNTLLDNDRVERDLRSHLEQAFGPKSEERYWAIFEELRGELGYADYLGALQRYRVEHPRDPHLLNVWSYLLEYPFADRVYAGALDLVRRLRRLGRTVILSDGDVVFQPRKIMRSGLWDAVDGHVLIYVHKEEMLEDVGQRYPAERYVMVDDKLRILAAMKQVWGPRLTTVFPRQGHYAMDPKLTAAFPPADLSVASVADLLEDDLASLLATIEAGSR